MTRILTAAALIVLLAAALLAPPPVFAAVIGLVVLLAWREFAHLAAEAGAPPLRGLGPILALGCACSFVLPGEAAPAAAVGLAAVLGALGGVAAGRAHPALALRRSTATVGGVLWLGLLPGFQLGLRTAEAGVAWLVLLYASVCAGDVAAYYVGKTVGRTPLLPDLSPKKTIEGAVGGLAASGVGAAVSAALLPPGPGPLAAAGIGLLLGAAGQVGDLLESALKRSARSKDSSSLLPGHGGVLDRIDGLLLGGAVLYAVVLYWP